MLELLAGLVIMSLVGGFALNAIVQSSTSFNKDKKSIDVNQNLSAVLEIVGNDIRQAGEGINEGSFPAIEFDVATASDVTNGLAANSSKIIIRKAVATQLTLCESSGIPGNGNNLPSNIKVAEVSSANDNCKFTAAAPTLSLFPASGVTTAPFSTFINIRQYRCQLDQLDPNYLSTTSDLCGSVSASGKEVLRAAMSDVNGHIRTFNYYDDNFDATSSPNKYEIKIDMTADDPTDIARNKTVPYPIGSPIYLIDERVYALDNAGNLTLSINGGSRQTLIKKIARFNISARLYTNALDQLVNPTPAPPTVVSPATTISATDFVCPDGGINNQPTAAAATTTDPRYICQFNYSTLSTDVAMNWKQLAGVRVFLEAKYDGTGQNATPTANDTAKLRAQAEYFPRNVLSK